MKCEQQCGRQATVYAIDPIPGGWGGRYCEPCVENLRFRIVDRLSNVRYAWIADGAQLTVAFPTLQKAREYAVTNATLCWRDGGRWWPVTP